MSLGYVDIEDGVIISVEKGSVTKPDARPVCAFSVKTESSELPIKVLLIGEYASIIWKRELRNYESANYDTEFPLEGTEDLAISKRCSVSFSAEIREIRQKEIVVQNPMELYFSKDSCYAVVNDEADPGELEA